MLEQLLADLRQVGLGDVRRLHAEPDRDHAHERDVVIVDGDLALVLVGSQSTVRVLAMSRRVDLGLVVGEGVVAELLRQRRTSCRPVKCSPSWRSSGKMSARGTRPRAAAPGGRRSTTRGTSTLSTTNTSQSPGWLCSISASAVPVPSYSLTLTLTPCRSSNGSQQRRIGVVAPDQRVQLLLRLRRSRRPAGSATSAVRQLIVKAMTVPPP